MKFRTFLVLLLQFTTSIVYAQDVLNGVVLSESDKGKLEAVQFANVYWEGTNYGTSTDSNGVFLLAVPDEADRLIVSYVGYVGDTLRPENFGEAITVILKQSLTLDPIPIEVRRRSTEMSFINPIQTFNLNEKELFKAACCNLSESFETNPSVDVNFTDALTGAKQIRMLGLNGPYTVINRENMPGIRGLGSPFGLTFIPGTWIESIQVSKGIGSVINGYESIAGQINVELKKPDLKEESNVNAFVNGAGRTEFNFDHSQKVSEQFSTAIFLHGSMRTFERDNNKDGFRDFPIQHQINGLNRWKFTAKSGWRAQLGIQFIQDDKEGGQTDELVEDRESSGGQFIPYRVKIESERIELFGKIGHVIPAYKYKTTGFQWSINQHEQQSIFGIRHYDVRQRNAYFNWIYQSIIDNTAHQFKTGLSFVYDEFEEDLDSLSFDRIERTPGAFLEYTYKPSNNFSLVLGGRVDHHNLYGSFVTPRLHVRYAVNEQTVLRFVGGKGHRSPTTLIDRQSLLATSRNFVFPIQNDLPYGLRMERAWNFGLNISKNFSLDYRDGSITADFYRTVFDNQVVVDLDESARQVYFYNLTGSSYSNSAQLQIDYELVKFLDVRLAYRWTEVKTDFRSGLRQQPLTPTHRFFINFGYETSSGEEGQNWTIDLTTQWTSRQRIPTTIDNSEANRRASYTSDFALVNMQITRNMKKNWSVYFGAENLLKYRQEDAIIGADNPFGNEFDASLVWAPIFGRNLYIGFRWKFGKSISNSMGEI